MVVIKNLKSKKNLAFIIFAILIIFSTCFYHAKIRKPDAYVTMDPLTVQFHFTGYDGSGKAEIEILKYPKILSLKNEKDREEIEKILHNPSIEWSKNENLRNGEEIFYYLRYPDTGKYNIKFDREYGSTGTRVQDLIPTN
ncbi:hypothetical protein QP518_01080 [Peptoniphilus harei]|uniref:hypothetical protein n=1 Tax=Peptoniphilus harei TaxID=54005 RepID=UPI00254A847B|nr:hypothetical protein [Peptoniphilus harei]MDK7354337.1 hypothetical protein [Peptoniphilus harei]MDK7370035.1 hypothetical protein [Peptoniphilus harei]